VTVGSQPTEAGLNQSLTAYAQNLRNTMQAITNWTIQVQNLGTSGLVALGFTSGDAASFLQFAGYLSTVAGCYNGTVQQGGSGGTGAITFNFYNALSAVCAGG
jgi:hypothetical protein